MLTLPPPPPLSQLVECALFLDFDGTLCPLETHPDLVRLDPRTADVLIALHNRLEGALCIISGRSLDSLRQSLGVLSGIPLVGGHGAEGPVGVTDPVPVHAALQRLEARLRTCLHACPGAWIELKPHGFSVHLPRDGSGELLTVAMQTAVDTEPLLRVQSGHLVVEATAAQYSKGTALRSLMRQPPFLERTPIMIGDDLTDEAAFAAAKDLKGFGVLVGAPRRTLADFALGDVAEVTRWLRRGVSTGQENAEALAPESSQSPTATGRPFATTPQDELTKACGCDQ